MNSVLEQEELRRQVNLYKWVHSIDLGQGQVTPGVWHPSRLILRAFDDIDFRGKKVLDIGCWDGLWSFEAEKRGAAQVFATDCLSQRHSRDMPTFTLAHRILRSRARYFPHQSVFNVNELGVQDFDVVIYCGVYYHLRDPLLAFARLRQVMKPGAILLVEGVVLRAEQQPIARFYYRQYHAKDPSNWWVPSPTCLREWVESSYFEIGREYQPSKSTPEATAEPPGDWILTTSRFANVDLDAGTEQDRQEAQDRKLFMRYALTARAVCRRDPHYLYPDDELRSFELAATPALKNGGPPAIAAGQVSRN